MLRIFILALLVASIQAHAKTYRDPATVRAFKHVYPCPSTLKGFGPCPGWIVDHINPLACYGPDAISNMQWQSTLESRKKDRWEIRGDATHKPCSGEPN